MYSVILQPPSTNYRLLPDKLPIMHVIGNSGDGVVWSGFPACSRPNERAGRCVKADPVPRLPRSSGVLQSSQRFTCEDALGKKEISKLEGKRKMRYKNLNFPTTSDFQFGDSIIDLKHLPFRHPKCVCRSESSPDIHAPKLFERFVGFEFFVKAVWRRYVEGSVVR